MKICSLCSNDPLQFPAKAWNDPLFESPNFVVLPSLGALVEGWLLLVPKKHFLCMGALPSSITAEMSEVKQNVCSFLQQSYGQVCTFEHGPSKPNCSIGCSVDHAHLHIVPVAFDLVSAVAPFLPEDVIWYEAGMEECQTAYNKGKDYLYLEQPIGTGRIATHQRFGSQLFRRAIAAQIGKRDQFNWREYPQLSNVSATVEMVQSLGGGMQSCKGRSQVAA